MGQTLDDSCIYDPPSPFITFSVVDQALGHTVDYGKRGQVVMNHVSKNMLLPNNLERDLATRIEPQAGQVNDWRDPLAREGTAAWIRRRSGGPAAYRP